MSFHEVQFPTNISFGTKGGPGYSTTILETDGGIEYRLPKWSAAKRRYDVSHGIKTRDDAYTVYQFFIARLGAANGFRFKDWIDYASTASGRTLDQQGANPAFGDQFLGTGDGVTSTFQLKKAYTSGPSTIYRNITKPVAGTILVGKNGANQASGWSIDTTTGLVTFSSPPSNGDSLTWGGQFDTPVRFDKQTDEEQGAMMISLTEYDVRDISVPLVEVADPGSVYEEAFTGGSEEICNTAPTTLSQSGGRVKVVNTTTNGIVILPDPTTVPPGGPIFYIINLGPNTLTVKRFDGTTLISFGTGNGVEILLTVDGGGNRIWYAI